MLLLKRLKGDKILQKKLCYNWLKKKELKMPKVIKKPAWVELSILTNDISSSSEP